MRQRRCVIGADLGTTTIKAVAFDVDGREIAQAAETVALVRAEVGAAEEDPAAVYDALVNALASAARQAGQLGYTVERVGLSAAMHSLIPVAADGTALTHALLWMDTRAQAEATALWESPAGKAVYERTGTPVHPMAPLAKLMWLRRQRPDQFQAAAKFVSLKEWVWYQLFGAWQVDASIASATGLYSLHEQGWDREALALAGIDAGRLSALVPTTYVRRGMRELRLAQAGISTETAFAIGASDGVLANLGVGAITPDVMVMTIGTSLAVRSGSAAPFTDTATRSFCYVLDGERYIVGGASNSGGIVLEWLYRNVLGGAAGNPAHGLPSDFAALVAAAGDAADADLLCLPYVAGERAPLWDGRARGVFFGLQLHHTGAHLLRAAIEGIIFNAHWIASGLFEALGPPRRIVATGKVLDVAWIRQLVADVFDLPVQSLGDVDASAMGAAALANIATGTWTWEEAVRRHQPAEGSTIEPTGRGAYQRKLDRYRRLTTVLMTDLADVYLGS